MDKDTLYSRWLNNELSEDEIQQLKSSGEWDILQSILEETNTWQLPELDETQFVKIQSKIQQSQSKVISINRWTWAYRAASIAIILSVAYWFFFRQNIVDIQNYEGTSTIQLPDSTEVRLIGRSRIRYDKKNFARARKIELDGKALLAVTRKGPFEAAFVGGKVQVLGTQFEILTGNELARVKCYEGRVKVLSEGKSESILNSGDGVRFALTENQMTSFHFDASGGINSEDNFDAAPLSEVLVALHIQFDIEIDARNIDINRKYSGKFTHDDIQKALDMVLVPMGIKYDLSPNQKKITLQ